MVKVATTNHLRLKALRMSDSYETLLLETPSDMVLLITLNGSDIGDSWQAVERRLRPALGPP